jgi:uncharacterized protein YbaP (TraB family)
MIHLNRETGSRPARIVLLACAVVLLFLNVRAVADTSVWVASSGASKVYLGGTVHLLRPSDYPLPAEYEQAYNDSERLFFETDIGSMNDLAVQASMLQQLTYNDSRTLQTVLSEEAYTALSDHLSSVGMPIMMMEKFKPGLIVTTLQLLEFQNMGFTPQGVDVYFNNRALGDGKAVGELETVEAQINYLANMGEGNESEFILLSLRDLEEIATSMEGLIGAWREGDMNELSELFIEDMQSESEDLYNALLVERNRNWLPVIESLFSEGNNEFVLVGAAHLVGEDGLLRMLEERGYQVEQL